MSEERNKDLALRTDKFPSLVDFYNTYDPDVMKEGERKYFKFYLKSLTDEERKILNTKQNFYLINFKNIGGLVMPLIVEAEFEDGSSKVYRFPAEIWRRNNQEVSKIIITEKVIKSITLDPFLETADVDLSNNNFPPQIAKSRFDIFRSDNVDQSNPMQRELEEEQSKKRRERNEKRRKESESKKMEEKKEAKSNKLKDEKTKKPKAGEETQSDPEAEPLVDEISPLDT